MTVSASSHLRETLGLLMAADAGPGPLWGHPRLGELYPRYLVALHTVIRSSVPLMVAARDKAWQQVGDDPVAGTLAAYLDRHIPEETDHDEWLLEDLARLGWPASDALEHMPSPAVAALVGAQYYYINHSRPVALLGYIGVLEGYPPTEELAHAAAARTGYPIEAFRTLRKHAHLDPHHRDDLDRCLDRCSLSPRDMELVVTNALATAERVVAMISELAAEHPVTKLASERIRLASEC
jgi:hypothetical protein